jgi:hypothetical protein
VGHATGRARDIEPEEVHLLSKKLRPLLAAAISACALMAVGAGPALATVSWTSTGTVKLSGSLTVYHNGADPKTCTFAAGSNNGSAYSTNSLLVHPLTDPINMVASCTGGTTLKITGAGVMYWDATLSSYMYKPNGDNQVLTSPYGSYATYIRLPWTNGSGGSFSTFTLNNTELGYFGVSDYLTATGTLSVTDGGTGTRTLTGT